MTTERQRINFDLDTLFPGEECTILGQTLHITPLSISQIAGLTKQAKTLVASLQAQGVTWDNLGTPENLFLIATTVVTDVPEILEEAANLHIEDVKRLPLAETVTLLHTIVDANIKSKEDLLGNLTSLIEKITPNLPEDEKKDQKEEK